MEKNNLNNLYIYELNRQIMKNYNHYYFVLIIMCFYLFLSNDYRNIYYDSEPDYIVNGLLILKNGVPIGNHHPGTVNYYIISLILLITKFFTLSLSATILIARSFYLILFLIITVVFFKEKKIIPFLTILTILIFPGLKNVFNVISAELLLVPLSLVLIFLLSKKKLNFYQIGLVLGLMINTKISAILVIPYVLIKLNKSKEIFVILFTTLISFTIFSVPVIKKAYYPFLRMLEEFSNPLISYLEIISFNTWFLNLILSVFLLLIITIILVYTYKKFKKKITKNSIRSFYSFSIVLIFALFIFVEGFETIRVRHLICAIPFIIYHNNRTLLKTKKQLILILPILILVYFTSSFENKISYIDKLLDAEKEKVYLFQDSGQLFKSEIFFLKWASYRYANSTDVIPKLWTEKFRNYEMIEFLNTRNIECIVEYSELYETKYIYSYDKCIVNQIKNNSKIFVAKGPDNQRFTREVIPKITSKINNLKFEKIKELNNLIIYQLEFN